MYTFPIYKILVGEHEAEGPLASPSCKWEHNIIMEGWK